AALTLAVSDGVGDDGYFAIPVLDWCEGVVAILVDSDGSYAGNVDGNARNLIAGYAVDCETVDFQFVAVIIPIIVKHIARTYRVFGNTQCVGFSNGWRVAVDGNRQRGGGGIPI